MTIGKNLSAKIPSLSFRPAFGAVRAAAIRFAGRVLSAVTRAGCKTLLLAGRRLRSESNPASLPTDESMAESTGGGFAHKHIWKISAFACPQRCRPCPGAGTLRAMGQSFRPGVAGTTVPFRDVFLFGQSIRLT